MNYEQNSRPIYPWQSSQTKSSSMPAHSVCVHLKYFTYCILSSPLRSSEKRPVQNKQSASCISSYVESSAKGTARSVSESDGVSDGVGSRQTLLFRRFEGPRRAFDASRLVLDLVACLIFFFWVASTICCKLNSLFSLLFHHDDFASGSGLARSDRHCRS
jgi:hypothetical protein